MNTSSGGGSGSAGAPIGPQQRRIWLHRSGAILGAAALVVVALWAAGVKLTPSSVRHVLQRAPAVRDAPAPVPANAATLPKAKPPGVEAFESEAPMRLVLASTSPGRNAKEGSASIGTSLENAQTLATGGLLSNGTRLVEVHADHVVLERGGARILLFVGNSQPPKVVGANRVSDRMEVEEQLLAVGGPAARGQEIKPPPLSAPAAMLRSQPVFANGVLKGLQVDAGVAKAQFSASGLQPGDIVVAIDGLQVEQPEQIEDLMGALASSAPVVITVERHGRLEHVSIDPKGIADPSSMAALPAPPPT